ncbi:MAG: M48 family metallopeptidase [Anaeroplasmataceae bacterium]|nr:M48 family metallopeptidase [Anaeroplasmataceae bacterium]
MIIVEVNQHNFKVEVSYKRMNRKIYMRIREGVIYITTPVKLSSKKIEDMILKNYNYIMKYMMESKKIDNQIHYLGKSYSLLILDSSSESIYIKDDEIVVMCNHPLAVQRLVEVLYTNTLKKVVETYSSDILAKFQIEDSVEFSYKRVKGYYGECFPKRRKIILSTRLAKYDLKYILSVIYHECAHFKYQNHQKEFYDYLEERYPKYRSVQKELRKIKYNEKY